MAESESPIGKPDAWVVEWDDDVDASDRWFRYPYQLVRNGRVVAVFDDATVEDAEALEAALRASQRGAAPVAWRPPLDVVLGAVDAEPELPESPEGYDAARATVRLLRTSSDEQAMEALRILVRLTKEGIRGRIRSLYADAAPPAQHGESSRPDSGRDRNPEAESDRPGGRTGEEPQAASGSAAPPSPEGDLERMLRRLVEAVDAAIDELGDAGRKDAARGLAYASVPVLDADGPLFAALRQQTSTLDKGDKDMDKGADKGVGLRVPEQASAHECDHPFPWRIEDDWTSEIRDAKGRVIAKVLRPNEQQRAVLEAITDRQASAPAEKEPHNWTDWAFHALRNVAMYGPDADGFWLMRRADVIDEIGAQLAALRGQRTQGER